VGHLVVAVLTEAQPVLLDADLDHELVDAREEVGQRLVVDHALAHGLA
jgi:hypothetical protein